MKESLQITLRKNRRSEDLIQIARKQKKDNVIHSFQQSSPALPEDELFDHQELFEIQWFDQMVKFFIEHMQANATDLERYRLFMPEALYDAMVKLSIVCDEHGVDYRPMDSMLKSIINKIKVTEKKLFEKTGVTSDVLADINYIETEASPEKEMQEAAVIFNRLLTIPDFFEEFQAIAKETYKKDSSVTIGHIKGYAKGHTLPSKWVYACAIDVIGKYDNPLTLIDEDSLLHLWVKPGLRAGKKPESIEVFLEKWKGSPAIISSVKALY